MKKSIVALIILSVFTSFGCQMSSGQIKKYDPKRKMSKTPAEWKKVLTPNAYHIMVESGTEPPFQNAYHDNHEKGVYVSAATGEVLFSSEDKFDSGTGWPSFYRALTGSIITKADHSFGMERTEVLCSRCSGHLGHVFPDGPKPTGLRYCMNGLALEFAPGRTIA